MAHVTHSSNVTASMVDNNCPFYGRSALAFPILANSHGNQCAIEIDSNSPCIMELAPDGPDWRRCPLLAQCFYPEGNDVRSAKWRTQ